MQVLSQLSNAFKIKELRDRILVTLGLLVVFRLGSHITLPGINPGAVEQFAKDAESSWGSLWQFAQIFSGSALAKLALCSLGIMPYITASIILQVLTKMDKRLEAIAEEGPSGQRKINQYSRLISIPIALFWAIGLVMSWAGSSNGAQPMLVDTGFFSLMMMITALVAGALFVMWLGEQISEFGLGNGASVLIMAGIVDALPTVVGKMFSDWQKGEIQHGEVLIVMLLLYVGVIVAVVFFTQAQRRIPVQHARQWRGQKITMGQRSYLPLRMIVAGVMPVIFASAVMQLPLFLARIPAFEWIKNVWERQGFVFTTLYVATIFFFSYFWTYLLMPPTKYADNLKENGSFIPGIRPGENTAEYLNKILSRITLVGATFLSMIAIFPDKVSQILHINWYESKILGGTGMLIVVGVSLDLMQKIESYLLMQHYGGFMGDGKAMRGRRA